MNQDQMQGNWQQVKGKLREKWGELTDDELEQTKGNRDQIAGKIREKYGIAKDEAQQQVAQVESSCSSC